jgi:hypothetical protein
MGREDFDNVARFEPVHVENHNLKSKFKEIKQLLKQLRQGSIRKK